VVKKFDDMEESEIDYLIIVQNSQWRLRGDEKLVCDSRMANVVCCTGNDSGKDLKNEL
jgi:hypothetical protein